MLLTLAWASTVPNNATLWLWVLACARTTPREFHAHIGQRQKARSPMDVFVFYFSRSCAIGSCATVVCLMRVTDIGVPSETNCSSYFLPSLSTAEHEMLEIWRVAKLP